ncbi:MAG: glycosyltransferase [Verrucomicrobiota bacterium]|nr:glycosyltransferase [Verrucomicrobiota bacterium]
MSRCDLHVHSRHSARSEEWLFRRFDFPDSSSDPRELYDALRGAGMDYVTITDHDTIDGSLEIAGLSQTFISEQVTTYFPQDSCKLHLLVWGLSEGQHAEITRIRENVFDLQVYLQAEGLCHAVAHPLYSINGKLAATHVERLILLFKHFEGINGLRDALLSNLTRELLDGLTATKVEEFANRHGLSPTHAEPWRKILVGGSDDHGGKFLASAFTETPPVRTPAEFLAEIRDGNCAAHGNGGTPLMLSHGFYNTLSAFIQDHFDERLGPTGPLLQTMFSRFMEGRDPTEFSLREKTGFVAKGVLSGKIFDLAKPANVSLWKQLSGYFAQPDVKAMLAQEVDAIEEPERRTFVMANLVCEQLAFRMFEKFVKQIQSGNVIESMQALSGIVPILVVLAPYIYGFHSQAPNRASLREIFTQMTGRIPRALQNRKRAWFTDTLDDVNGVATTIRKMAAAAAEAGEELVVVTTRSEMRADDIPIQIFRPIGEFELPEYELQKLSFPPIMQMLDYVQREQFTEIIISTPGPIGLTGLLAAKMLNLRTSAIYHTDFPQYIRILTDDSFLESLAWSYMHWFYGQAETVFVNSEQYRESWISRGFAPEKLKILPRGLDTELFNPTRRDLHFWDRYDPSATSPGGELVRLLYVGRISREKDLDVLAAAYAQFQKEGADVRLYLVGDGPYLDALRESLPGAVFTGYLAGEELANAYASADVFVFPSTTDTFGNVIIEALASGLPVIVSDLGGPKELVTDGVNGIVTRARDIENLIAAIKTLSTDKEVRTRMGASARQSVLNRNWPDAFRHFWASTLD